MITRPFKDKTIEFAYGLIHDFFDLYDLRPAVHDIENIIKAAASVKIWKRDSPYHLIFFIENLEMLCSAAFTIHYTLSTISDAILMLDSGEQSDPDTTVQKHFVNPNQIVSAWECFPRHLSAKQYHDPYRLFKKIADSFSEPEWKEILKDLIEYTLSRSSIDGKYASYELLTIRQRLLQLIEACHLIEVRTYIKP